MHIPKHYAHQLVFLSKNLCEKISGNVHEKIYPFNKLNMKVDFFFHFNILGYLLNHVYNFGEFS